MGRSPPLPHHPQCRRQRGTAGAQYAGSSGLINIKRDDALLHYLTGHYRTKFGLNALAQQVVRFLEQEFGRKNRGIDTRGRHALMNFEYVAFHLRHTNGMRVTRFCELWGMSQIRSLKNTPSGLNSTRPLRDPKGVA